MFCALVTGQGIFRCLVETDATTPDRNQTPDCLMHSISRGWLPKLEAVSLRVDSPAKAAVFVFFDVIVDGNSAVSESLEHSIEIVHALIHHRHLASGSEIPSRGEKPPR